MGTLRTLISAQRFSLGRLLSTHCFHDEDGWSGSRRVHDRGAVLRLAHRWSEAVAFAVVLHDRHPDYLEGVTKGWSNVVAKYVRKVERSESGSVGEQAVDEAFLADYPALHEYLTLDWSEGGRRETSTLTVSCEAGRWKARIADRDNALVAFLTGSGFYDILGTLERHLANGTCDWREDQFAKPRSKRSK